MCAYESMNRTCGCFVASASGSNSAASAVSNRRKCILIALPSLQLRSLRLSATSGTARAVQVPYRRRPTRYGSTGSYRYAYARAGSPARVSL